MWILRRARGIEQRADFGSSAIPGPLEGARGNAGPMVTDATSLAHIDVFKCRSLRADTVAMLPFRAYRTRAYTAGTGVRTYAERVPNQPTLLTDPMPGDLGSEFSFKHRVMDSLTGAGEAFIEIAARDTLGVPTAVYPVHPSCVRDVKLNDRGWKTYHMHNGEIYGDVRHGGTMIHIPAYVQAGSLRGLSPISACRQGIALGMAAEEFGTRFFGDGANPSGVLTTDADINPDDAKAMKRQWIQTYGSLSREPAVLYGGLKWQPISITPEESQFIETRRFQSGQIAALYRIPPHMVGDVDKTISWGTGIEEMGLGFVTYSLGPWLTRIEQALSFLLPRGQYVKANVGALLRGRILDQYQAFATAKQWGWLSTNDIRELIDLVPIDGGDTYLQPLNMVDA